MPKISKNSVIVITLSVVSLVLGGTFFVISQNKSGQNLTSNSSNSSSSISSQSSSSAISTNQSPYLGGAVGGGSSSQSQTQNSTISNQSNSINPQQSSNSSFSTLQNTSPNPKIQPLVADETHDVAVIEECDLVVRFPKQLKARKDVDASNPNNSTVIVLEDPNKLNGKLKPSSIYNLECGNKKYEIIQAEATNDKNFADESGLDLSKVLELQRYIQPPLGGIDINKGVFKAGSVTTFTKNNVDQFLYYSLSQSGFYQSENSFPAIQIQFNSLAPSTPSVKL
jgi:hypothetical protein